MLNAHHVAVVPTILSFQSKLFNLKVIKLYLNFVPPVDCRFDVRVSSTNTCVLYELIPRLRDSESVLLTGQMARADRSI